MHVNTLLVQQVLADPAWAKKLSDEDRSGLTTLFWSNVNPRLARGLAEQGAELKVSDVDDQKDAGQGTRRGMG